LDILLDTGYSEVSVNLFGPSRKVVGYDVYYPNPILSKTFLVVQLSITEQHKD